MQLVHTTLTGKYPDVATSQKAISKIMRFAKLQGFVLGDIANNPVPSPSDAPSSAEMVNQSRNIGQLHDGADADTIDFRKSSIN